MLEFVHQVAAAVWLGGLITLGALVPALRRAGVERPQLQAMARQFGRVSWSAMVVLVVSGVWRYWPNRVSLDAATWFRVKVALVVLVVGLALAHQITARRTTPAVRGVLQGVTLLVSLAIFAAATAL